MPDAPPPSAALRRDLLAMVVDAIAFSVMVGCGETYLPAFALALGLGPVAAGLVASVPVLVGAVVQLAAPFAVAGLGSHRSWVVICTTIQAVSFVPLVACASRGRAELWELLAAASLYWSAGMGAVSAWIAWMAVLVPERVRTPYFAHRNRLGQVGVLGGFVLGGLLLHAAESRGLVLQAFAGLFTAAAIFRLVSTAALLACREPPTSRAAAGERLAPLRRVPARTLAAVLGMSAKPSGALVAYLCSFAFGTHVAAPYFAPFMLRELGFSYWSFMLVMATSFLAKAVFLPAIGRLASRTGALRLLWLASLAIVPLALCWLPAANVAALCAVQVMAGTAWAAYELATSVLLFEAVRDSERRAVMTAYNVGLATATVAGAACGGALLRGLGETWTAYAAVFAASVVLRLAALPALRRLRMPR